MLVGKILRNRYKIIQVLGSGGFGDTYLAEDIDLLGHPPCVKEDANTGEILWRDRVQVSKAFAEILQNMVFYHFSQRYKSAIEALQAVQSLASTNILILKLKICLIIGLKISNMTRKD